MTAAILAAAALQGASITHGFGIMRADLLVKEIARSSGLPWEAPSFTKDYVYAGVKEMAPEDLAGALAKVLHGRWTQSGDRMVLRPERPEKEAVWARAVEQAAAYLASPPPPAFEEADLKKTAAVLDQAMNREDLTPEAMALVVKFIRSNPVSLASDGLVRLIGLSDMSSLPPKERRVYSTSPTASQKRLPAGAEKILDQMAANTQVLERLRQHLSQQHEVEDGMTRDILKAAAKGRLGAELVLEIAAGSYLAGLSIIDPQTGATVAGDRNFLFPAVDENSPQPRPLTLGMTGKKLAGGPDRLRLPDGLSAPGAGAPLDPRIAALLEDPRKGELLQATAAPVLDEIVRLSGRGLICVTEDRLPLWAADDQVDLGRFAARLGVCDGRVDFTVDEMGQNTVVALGSLTAMRGQRFSRPLLADFIRKSKAGTSFIDCLADLALGSGEDGPGMMAGVLIQKTTGRVIPALDDQQWTLLCYYGRQSALERKTARESALDRSFAAMNPLMARDAYLLNWGTGTGLIPEKRPSVQDGGDPGVIRGAWDRTGVDEFAAGRSTDPTLEVETTRVLDRPLGPDSIVRLTLREARALYLVNGEDMIPAEPSLAAQQVFNSGPADSSGFLISRGFTPGTSTLLMAECIHPGRGRVVRKLVLDEASRTAKPLALNEMPEAFRKAVDERVQWLRKNTGSSGDGGSGASGPP